MISGLLAHPEPSKDRNVVGRREGLAMDALELLKHLIDPRSPRNPWKDERIRIRNQLMVVWLYGLGLRRGELLAIKVGDVKFQENTVLVPRLTR